MKIRTLVLVLSAVIVACFCVDIAYYKNREEKVVTISDKNVKRYNDKDKYLIYTDKGTFEICDSIYIWRFDSSDIYGNIQIGETYKIKVAGWRIPVFSVYQNIIEVENELES